MFDVGVHNWCTNKNLTSETCFFFFCSCILTIHLLFLLFPDSIQVYLFPLFKSLDCFISYSFFPLEPESRQNWGAKTENSLRVIYDFRNKCFPVEHLLVFNRGCIQHDAMRVEVVLVEERQVNKSPNKAWVHFHAALPPGHRPLHIQVKSAFCLPKPCDLWPGSIDQTS